MPAPNPIWGVHVTPGAVAWAKVRREADGSFRVLEWSASAAPGTSADAMRHAMQGLQRRGVKGWGTFVALPDDAGCLVTARLTSEEVDLSGDDLVRELHEHTPFEADTAVLRYRPLATDGRRRVLLVAALPVAQERVLEDVVLTGDDGTIGLGFASAATWRGAEALGIAEPPAFVVEVHAHTTIVLAWDAGNASYASRVRRYLVASGAEDLRADPTLVDAIAADIHNAADYHRAQQHAPKDAPTDLPLPVFVPAGRALADSALRTALARTLASGFAGVPARGQSDTPVAFDKDPGEQLIALVGAVGAALEGFDPADERLALRHLPRDIATPASGSAWPWVGTAAALAAAGGAYWWFGVRGRDDPSVRTPTTVTPAPAEIVSMDGPIADLVRRACYADVLGDVSALLLAGRWSEASLDITWGEDGYTARLAAAPAAPPPDARASATILQSALTARAGALDVSASPRGTGGASVSWRRAPATCPDAKAIPEAAKSKAAKILQSAQTSFATRPHGQPADGGALSYPAPTEGPLARMLAWAPAQGPDAAAWNGRTILLTDGDPVAVAGARGSGAGIDEVLRRAAPPALPGRIDLPPPQAMEVALEPVGDACVRLRWGPGPAGRKLMRRGPATSSAPPSGDWTLVRELPPAEGEHDDWISAAGTYEWRVETAADQSPGKAYEVSPAVSVEPESLLPGGGARLRLTRAWKGRTVVAYADVPVGGSVRADAREGGERLPLDARSVLKAARNRETLETVDARVPRLHPDGRVQRDAGGDPVLEPRTVKRPLQFLDADLADPSGNVRTVSRKMTDG